MNSKNVTTSNQLDKWQQMLAIVSQQPIIAQSNLDYQFRKICRIRFLAENVLVCLMQYIGLMLTMPTSPLWFASGSACAFIFMRGYSVLLGVWLGSFVAYYFSQVGMMNTCLIASIYTMQPLLLLWITHRYIGPTILFYRLNIFIKFLFVSSIITGLTSLLLTQLSIISLFNGERWLLWWLANLNGVLIVGCAIVTWDMYFPERDVFKKMNKNLFALMFGVLLLITSFILFSVAPALVIFLGLSLLLISIGINFYFGWCGTITAIFMSSLMLCIGDYIKLPLFLNEFSGKLSLFLSLILLLTVLVGLLIKSGKECNAHESLGNFVIKNK